jgi:hypothetical protein
MRGGVGFEGWRTIVDLLQSYLSILGEALLGFTAQHEGFWLLRRRHGRMMLRIHHVRHSNFESKQRLSGRRVVMMMRWRDTADRSVLNETLPISSGWQVGCCHDRRRERVSIVRTVGMLGSGTSMKQAVVAR